MRNETANNECRANAMAIMRGWDAELKAMGTDIPERTDEDILRDLGAGPGLWDRDEWLAALEAGDVAAIVAGRAMWGIEVF
jgi:hypothetical protein